MLAYTISQIVLYSPGCFFFYPWKPAMQLLHGDTYMVGFKHFRRDHSDPLNLALHLVALAMQLLGNFAVLAAIDTAVLQVYPSLPQPAPIALPPAFGGTLSGSVRWVSLCTGLLWVMMLLPTPAPFACTLCSVASIVAAYLAVPHLSAHGLEAGCVGIFIAVLVVGSVFFERRVDSPVNAIVRSGGGAGKKRVSAKVLLTDLTRTIVIFGGVLGVRLGSEYCYGGSLVPWATSVNFALLVVMVALSALAKPTVPCVLAGVSLMRVASALTSQETLLYLACAYTAQGFQGRAHEITRQKATLLQTNNVSDASVKLGFEWSHVTYFPTLLWHSVYESLTQPVGSAKVKK